MKDTLTEMKNHLQGFYKWMESRIRSMIWNIWMQNTPHQNSKEEKRVQKNEDSVRRLWDDFKHTNNTLWGCWKKREHEFENLFEKMTENFPNLVKVGFDGCQIGGRSGDWVVKVKILRNTKIVTE